MRKFWEELTKPSFSLIELCVFVFIGSMLTSLIFGKVF